MNRKENRERKINKIVKIATSLFMEQGYENTTVRQILKEAGVSTGSLYNFFNNKEEILLSVFDSIGKEVQILSGKITSDFEEPGLGNFIAVATEKMAMLENKRLQNIYRFIWSVQSVQEWILRYRVKNAKRILSTLDLDFPDDEIYVRILAVMGVERALVEAKIDGRINIKPQELWALQTRMFLASFGVSNERSDKIIQRVMEVMRKKGYRYKKVFINKITKNLA